jgi:hypothetical protein
MVLTDEEKLKRRKEAQRKYYLKNKDKNYERIKNWRVNNKDYYLYKQGTYSQMYYEMNRKQISERCKERYQLKKITI